MTGIKGAEILSVGSELLLGDIVNSNAVYISRRLAELGINMLWQTTVGDNPARLEEAVKTALGRCDLVITTGGLGPTYCDITKETVSAALGRELYLHEESLMHIRDYFAHACRSMSSNNEKQAMMPEGAIVFPNHHGTAPGVAVESGDKIVIMLPGPPWEMEPMFEESAVPFLSKFSDMTILSHNLNVFGIGEASLESLLHELMASSTNPTAAPYCREGETRIRVTAKADSLDECERMCAEMIEKIKATPAGKYIYGIETTLEQTAVRRLLDARMTVSTAESCTGGMIAARLTAVPGSSGAFFGSVVAYDNSIKRSVLGVSEDTLARFGAVSSECAAEMAQGVRRVCGTDVGIAVTGIAGPGGGTPEKPVGCIFIAADTARGTEVKRLSLEGSREHIRNLTAANALMLLIEHTVR